MAKKGDANGMFLLKRLCLARSTLEWERVRLTALSIASLSKLEKKSMRFLWQKHSKCFFVQYAISMTVVAMRMIQSTTTLGITMQHPKI